MKFIEYFSAYREGNALAVYTSLNLLQKESVKFKWSTSQTISVL